MLKFLKWLFGLFSPYVDPFERKVDRFFKHIKSTDNINTIKRKLLKLMQENLIILNIWLEKKFKGYKYLSKRTRREMYKNSQFIVASFKEFAQNPISKEQISAELASHKLSFPESQKEKIIYLRTIMEYLKPGPRYHYIKTASFGKLLKNINIQKIEGDCNQIVTLYIYLYSLKYPIQDLEIKLLPNHVCLHFNKIDIEATNAEFANYKKYDHILPATEIISTNLLDLADFREEIQSLSARTLLKSAQLAYAISSLKSLVSKNLNIAYQNLGVAAMKANDFKTAVFYLSKTNDKELVKTAYHNGAIHHMKKNSFSKARYFAKQSHNKELIKAVEHNEGSYYYKNGKIDKALKIFIHLGNKDMEKACYSKKYNILYKKVKNDRTIAELKKHKGTYKKMLSLARKMQDSELEKSLQKTLSQI